jgi:hypothetical protein
MKKSEVNKIGRGSQKSHISLQRAAELTARMDNLVKCINDVHKESNSGQAGIQARIDAAITQINDKFDKSDGVVDNVLASVVATLRSVTGMEEKVASFKARVNERLDKLEDMLKDYATVKDDANVAECKADRALREIVEIGKRLDEYADSLSPPRNPTFKVQLDEFTAPKVPPESEKIYMDFIHDRIVEDKPEPAKPKHDDYITHEALDRTCMVMEIIESTLQNHAFFTDHIEYVRKIEKAQAFLMEVYQAIGKNHLRG